MFELTIPHGNLPSELIGTHRLKLEKDTPQGRVWGLSKYLPNVDVLILEDTAGLYLELRLCKAHEIAAGYHADHTEGDEITFHECPDTEYAPLNVPHWETPTTITVRRVG